MKEWLEAYIKALVTRPDEVSISQKDGIQTIVLSINLADEDSHLFTGRFNRLIRSLNAVASLAGAKPRKRYVVKVV